MSFKYTKYLFNDEVDRKFLAICNAIKICISWLFLICALATIIETRAFQLDKGDSFKIATLVLLIATIISNGAYILLFNHTYKRSMAKKSEAIFENSPYAILNMKFVIAKSRYKKIFKNMLIAASVGTVVFAIALIAAPYLDKGVGGSYYYVVSFIMACAFALIMSAVYAYYNAKRTSSFVVSATAQLTQILEIENKQNSNILDGSLDSFAIAESLGYLKNKTYLFPNAELREKYCHRSKVIETVLVCFAPIIFALAVVFGYFVNLWSLIALNSAIVICIIVYLSVSFGYTKKPLNEQQKIVNSDLNKYAVTKKLFELYDNKKLKFFNIIMYSVMYLLCNAVFLNLIYSWHIAILCSLLAAVLMVGIAIMVVNSKASKTFKKQSSILEEESEKNYGDIFKIKVEPKIEELAPVEEKKTKIKEDKRKEKKEDKAIIKEEIVVKNEQPQEPKKPEPKKIIIKQAKENQEKLKAIVEKETDDKTIEPPKETLFDELDSDVRRNIIKTNQEVVDFDKREFKVANQAENMFDSLNEDLAKADKELNNEATSKETNLAEIDLSEIKSTLVKTTPKAKSLNNPADLSDEELDEEVTKILDKVKKNNKRQ